ncbi:MAG: hypothetical protein H8E98_04895 [Bacteroidetes bacterium]|nr:hypothetical protein [Bacteroidota bacterium]
MASTILIRRGTNAARLIITPATGELIYTTDTKKLYVGDGITAGGNKIDDATFEALVANGDVGIGSTQVAYGNHNHISVYEAKNTNIQTHISSTSNPHATTKSHVGLGNVTNDAQIPLSQKGAVNGVASLDASGKISANQVPSIAITTANVVASQSAQLALSAQEGDLAIRSDENKSYIHNGGTAADMTDWTLLQTPTDAVLSVDGQTGTVSLSNVYQPKDANIVSDGSYVHTDNNFTTTLKSKLDGVESGATADQTKADIDALGINAATVNTKTVLTNVPAGAVFTDTTYSVGDGGLSQINFTSTLKSKLDGIESGATADQTKTDIDALGINAATVNSKTVLTNVPSGAVFTDTTYTVGDGGLTQKNFTTAFSDKLASIESGATADQTKADIESLGLTVDGGTF